MTNRGEISGDDRGVELGQAMLMDDSSSFGQLAPYYVVFGFLLAVVVVVAVCCCCPLCGCRAAPHWAVVERVRLWVRQAVAKCRCPWPGLPCRRRRNRQTVHDASTADVPPEESGPPSYLEATASGLVGSGRGAPSSAPAGTGATTATATHHVVIVGLPPHSGGIAAWLPAPIRPFRFGRRITAEPAATAASAAVVEASDNSNRSVLEGPSSSSSDHFVAAAAPSLPSYEEAIKMSK